MTDIKAPVAWILRAGPTDRVVVEITNNAERAHIWRATNCSFESVTPLYVEADIKALQTELTAAKAEIERLRVDAERFEWVLDEPEASRHLLNLLREKKGDKASFRTMIDRIRKSQKSAAIDAARGKV